MEPMLDECRIVIVVDNETDTLSSVEEGIPQLPELAGTSRARPAAPPTATSAARRSSTCAWRVTASRRW